MRSAGSTLEGVPSRWLDRAALVLVVVWLLVLAGAGTGKTSTLVGRCLGCLLHEKPPVSLDEILMVTFTDAAAAEMRQRIRIRLEEQLKQIL